MTTNRLAALIASTIAIALGWLVASFAVVPAIVFLAVLLGWYVGVALAVGWLVLGILAVAMCHSRPPIAIALTAIGAVTAVTAFVYVAAVLSQFDVGS